MFLCHPIMCGLLHYTKAKNNFKTLLRISQCFKSISNTVVPSNSCLSIRLAQNCKKNKWIYCPTPISIYWYSRMIFNKYPSTTVSLLVSKCRKQSDYPNQNIYQIVLKYTMFPTQNIKFSLGTVNILYV